MSGTSNFPLGPDQAARGESTRHSVEATELFIRSGLRLPYLPRPTPDPNDDKDVADSALGSVLQANLTAYIDAETLCECAWALREHNTQDWKLDQLKVLVSHLYGDTVPKPGVEGLDNKMPYYDVYQTCERATDNRSMECRQDGAQKEGGLVYMRLLDTYEHFRNNQNGGGSHEFYEYYQQGRPVGHDRDLATLSGKARFEAYVEGRIKLHVSEERSSVPTRADSLFQSSSDRPRVRALHECQYGRYTEADEASGLVRTITPLWHWDELGRRRLWNKPYERGEAWQRRVDFDLLEGYVDMSTTRRMSSYNVLTKPLKPTLLPPSYTTLTDGQVGAILEFLKHGRLSTNTMHVAWPATFDSQGYIHPHRLQHGLPALMWFDQSNLPVSRSPGYYFVVFNSRYSLCGRATMLKIVGERNVQRRGSMPFSHQRPGYKWCASSGSVQYQPRQPVLRPDLSLNPQIQIILEDLPQFVDWPSMDEDFVRFLSLNPLVPPRISALLVGWEDIDFRTGHHRDASPSRFDSVDSDDYVLFRDDEDNAKVGIDNVKDYDEVSDIDNCEDSDEEDEIDGIEDYNENDEIDTTVDFGEEWLIAHPLLSFALPRNLHEKLSTDDIRVSSTQGADSTSLVDATASLQHHHTDNRTVEQELARIRIQLDRTRVKHLDELAELQMQNTLDAFERGYDQQTKDLSMLGLEKWKLAEALGRYNAESALKLKTAECAQMSSKLAKLGAAGMGEGGRDHKLSADFPDDVREQHQWSVGSIIARSAVPQYVASLQVPHGNPSTGRTEALTEDALTEATPDDDEPQPSPEYELLSATRKRLAIEEAEIAASHKRSKYGSKTGWDLGMVWD